MKSLGIHLCFFVFVLFHFKIFPLVILIRIQESDDCIRVVNDNIINAPVFSNYLLSLHTPHVTRYHFLQYSSMQEKKNEKNLIQLNHTNVGTMNSLIVSRLFLNSY